MIMESCPSLILVLWLMGILANYYHCFLIWSFVIAVSLFSPPSLEVLCESLPLTLPILVCCCIPLSLSWSFVYSASFPCWGMFVSYCYHFSCHSGNQVFCLAFLHSRKKGCGGVCDSRQLLYLKKCTSFQANWPFTISILCYSGRMRNGS